MLEFTISSLYIFAIAHYCEDIRLELTNSDLSLSSVRLIQSILKDITTRKLKVL